MRGIDLLKDIGYIDDSLVQEAALETGKTKTTKVLQWSKWARWGSIAAGFVVLCVAAVALRQGARSYDATESACTTDTASQIYTMNDAALEEAKENFAEEKMADKAVSSSTTADSINQDTAIVAEEAMVESQELQIVKDYTVEKEVDGEAVDLGATVCYVEPEKGEYYYFNKLEEAMKAYAGQAVQYYVTIDVFRDGEQITLEAIYGGYEVYDKNTPLIKEYKRLLAEGYKVIIEEGELRGYFTEEELNTFAVNPEYGYVFRFTNDF